MNSRIKNGIFSYDNAKTISKEFEKLTTSSKIYFIYIRAMVRINNITCQNNSACQ